MTTVTQIERLWKSNTYDRLFRYLVVGRLEASLGLELEFGKANPAAALAIIRLDELGQSHTALNSRLVSFLLNRQQSDGGWGDPMTTALCIRALSCGQGQGLAIDSGIAYLLNMQKPEGIWPNIPIRRMPADPFGSAFVLLQLGDNACFGQTPAFFDAVHWFQTHEHVLDAQTRQLWEHASLRCDMRGIAGEPAVHLWS